MRILVKSLVYHATGDTTMSKFKLRTSGTASGDLAKILKSIAFIGEREKPIQDSGPRYKLEVIIKTM